MNTLHTPSPWDYDRGVVDADQSSGSIGRVTICEHVYGAAGSPDMATAEANGNLIAAAPDLLAVLRDVIDETAFYQAKFSSSEWRKKARAALAKATGAA